MAAIVVGLMLPAYVAAADPPGTGFLIDSETGNPFRVAGSVGRPRVDLDALATAH